MICVRPFTVVLLHTSSFWSNFFPQAIRTLTSDLTRAQMHTCLWLMTYFLYSILYILYFVIYLKTKIILLFIHFTFFIFLFFTVNIVNTQIPIRPIQDSCRILHFLYVYVSKTFLAFLSIRSCRERESERCQHHNKASSQVVRRFDDIESHNDSRTQTDGRRKSLLWTNSSSSLGQVALREEGDQEVHTCWLYSTAGWLSHRTALLQSTRKTRVWQLLLVSFLHRPSQKTHTHNTYKHTVIGIPLQFAF